MIVPQTLNQRDFLNPQKMPRSSELEAREQRYQAWREQDGPLLDWTAKTADAFLGVLPALETGLVTASAGAARGVVRGAALEEGQERLIMAANLAAIGVALAGLPINSAAIEVFKENPGGSLGKALVGGVAQVRSGFSSWGKLPEQTRQEVASLTENVLQKLYPPPQEPAWQQRFLRGAAGEVVGLATGGWVGLRHGFESAQGQGQQLVDWLQKNIYLNMHEEPLWKVL